MRQTDQILKDSYSTDMGAVKTMAGRPTFRRQAGSGDDFSTDLVVSDVHSIRQYIHSVTGNLAYLQVFYDKGNCNFTPLFYDRDKLAAFLADDTIKQTFDKVKVRRKDN